VKSATPMATAPPTTVDLRATDPPMVVDLPLPIAK